MGLPAGPVPGAPGAARRHDLAATATHPLRGRGSRVWACPGGPGAKQLARSEFGDARTAAGLLVGAEPHRALAVGSSGRTAGRRADHAAVGGAGCAPALPLASRRARARLGA
ncbi:MAG: hypothetical protein ACK56I_09215, partial [bacterium]